MVISTLSRTKQCRAIFPNGEEGQVAYERHFFGLIDLIDILGFLGKLKLACDKNPIYEAAEMWVLPFFVKNVPDTILNSCMSTATRIASAVKLAETVDLTTKKKPLCSYPEVAIYLLNKFGNDQKISKMDFAILHYTQLASMNSKKYTFNLYAKSCKGLTFTTGQD